MRTPPPALLLNRELSWLDFNARVLHEAQDERTPLLERLKFLAIVDTNLDEFFMVRVAGLRRRLAAGATTSPPDGLPIPSQLDEIDRRVRELATQQRACLHEVVLPALARHGVRLVGMDDLSPAEWSAIDTFFETQVFPVLTPLAVEPGQPFPYITNLALSLAVEVREPDTGTVRFAHVKVPKSLPRWVPLERPLHFIPLEQVIGANIGDLFPGMQIMSSHAFRVTRYTDLDLGSLEDPDDLLATIEEQVFQRRFAEVVRVEVQDDMPERIRRLLLDELREDHAAPQGRDSAVPQLADQDVHVAGSLLDLGDLHALAVLEVPALRDAPFSPVVPVPVRDGERSMFAMVREQDLLVHHPYDAFGATVERFIDEAASDPQVLAIKMTLYRTSGDTAVVRALARAAEAGKQVAVLVELKARFDEANNITWARTLENFGVHVSFGPPALKTHAKVAMVVRREDDGIRRYVHIGSGNYNSKTARTYSDIGLFTANRSIAADVSDLFNMLTGFSRQRLYRRLLVAPTNMRQRFLEMIDREAANAQAGRPAGIVGKMNALVDPEIIHALYSASQAGVRIDLIVRGTCCLRPGLPAVSDGIRVISIVGRFLEHARVWRFENGGEPEYYFGSADWMPRNFDRRVEAVTPVAPSVLQERIERLFTTQLLDNRNAWELAPDGSWRQRTPGDEAERSSHTAFMRDSWGMERALPPEDPVPDRPRHDAAPRGRE